MWLRKHAGGRSHKLYNSINPVRFNDRIVNDWCCTCRKRCCCCLLGKPQFTIRVARADLLPGPPRQKPKEYAWISVSRGQLCFFSPVTSQQTRALWRGFLGVPVEMGPWLKAIKSLNRCPLGGWQGGRKPRGIQRHIRFWRRSYVTWQKSPKKHGFKSIKERYWWAIFPHTPNLAWCNQFFFSLELF